MNDQLVFSKQASLIARFVSEESLWSKPGLSFWSADSDFLQVGTWNHPEGSRLPAHIHNSFARESGRTQEAILVMSGSLVARLFDDDGTPITEIRMSAGDLLICLNGGHGYTIQEEGTKVLEFKNGPYLGAEVDRRRIE